MIATTLMLVLTVAPKVAVPGLSGVGIEKARAEFYTEHYAQQLRAAGLQVITQAEIAALLGMERQRSLLGCSEDTGACMAELAAALGTETVSLGGIAKLDGGSFQVTLKILQASNGKVLSARAGRVTGEEALTDALTRSAFDMAREVLTALRPNETFSSLERDFSRRPLRGWSVVPAVVGVGAIIFGAVMLGQASATHRQLTEDPATHLSLTEAQNLASTGKTSLGLGWGGVLVGAAAIGAAVTMFFWKEELTSLQAWLDSHGAGLAVGGLW